MAYEVPPLQYAYESLEPVIDVETMRLHHDAHHLEYVNALNKVIAGVPELKDKSIEALMRELKEVPEAARETIRRIGGAHANHQLFWKIMAPAGQSGEGPTGELAWHIRRDFGSVDEMKHAFERAGAEHIGAGWVFLSIDRPTKKLEILTLPNHDSVLPLGKPALFANDLWEHAYYLKYRNDRLGYLKAWWDVVNWPYIDVRLRGILDGRQQI
jgi:Fe-Mn family superoxide dismutase